MFSVVWYNGQNTMAAKPYTENSWNCLIQFIVDSFKHLHYIVDSVEYHPKIELFDRIPNSFETL